MNDNDCIQTDFLGKIYAPDAQTIRVGRFDFPILPPQQLEPDPHPLPVNYMTEKRGIPFLQRHYFHCHVADRLFEKLWKHFPRYTRQIAQVGGFIGTDYSVYQDYPVEKQMYNVYRNRVIAYAITKINPNLIPSATFGGEDTWSWCFLGLPKRSTVSITTNGVLSNTNAMRLFIGGVDELVRQLEPYAIAVCGTIPNWLWTKYPNVKIFPIDNFNQMRRRQANASTLITSASIKPSPIYITVVLPYPCETLNVGHYHLRDKY